MKYIASFPGSPNLFNVLARCIYITCCIYVVYILHVYILQNKCHNRYFSEDDIYTLLFFNVNLFILTKHVAAVMHILADYIMIHSIT